MHTYSTDNDFRVTLLGLLGVAAYIIVYMLNVYLFSLLNSLIPIEIPEMLFIGITFGGVFPAVYMLFASWIWNRPWMPSFIVAVPDLTGHWEGHIRSSFKGEISREYLAADGGDKNERYREMKATLDIRQTWRKIAITFETGRSSSYSTSASFQLGATLHPRLSYLFQNEGPSPDEQSASEGRYTGVAEFKLREADGDALLEGVYYTGPAREHTEGPSDEAKTNYGSVEFTRASREPQM